MIWNVGQGSWATLIEKDSCLHIDMGGERAPYSLILKRCEKRKNKILLTHLDNDHINKIKSFKLNVQHLCLFPHNFIELKTKKYWLNKIEPCKGTHSSVKVIHRPYLSKNKNQSSIVYVVKNKILISGDSPSSEEKKWSKKVPKSVSILVLGHHGSITSTSKKLLKESSFDLAVASARRKRFGHPHKKIEERLKKFKVPLIVTQEWGHIYFYL